MTDQSATANVTASDDEKSSRFLWLIGIVLLMFFAWKAGPALAYWEQIAGQVLSRDASSSNGSDRDVTTNVMFFLLAYGRRALIILCCLLVTAAATGARRGEGWFCLAVAALLGWFVGNEFETAQAALAACKARAGLFDFCSLEAPIISTLSFCAIVVLMSAGEALKAFSRFASKE